MLLDDLCGLQFEVSDALEPAHRAALASACQQLDIAPARPSLGTAASARVDSERHEALRLALSATRDLVEPSRFDLQVLAVLMRLAIEVEGLQGIWGSLRLVAQLLREGWGPLERARAVLSSGEREKLDRRRGSYLDAVFAQAYFWVARRREHAEPALAESLASDRSEWMALLDTVEACLSQSSLPSGRWQQLRQSLDEILRTHAADVAAPLDREPQEPGAPLAERPAAPAAEPQTTASTALLDVSTRFWELQRRLDAFGGLLDSGQFEKARIVARDLGQSLEHFDVAGYFPALFAAYFELSARYADPLSAPDSPESVRCAALTQLYRTDLTRFLQLSIERHG